MTGELLSFAAAIGAAGWDRLGLAAPPCARLHRGALQRRPALTRKKPNGVLCVERARPAFVHYPGFRWRALPPTNGGSGPAGLPLAIGCAVLRA
ncbi:hypothetical protein, partial [Xanthomonas cannabis]|uniref:hypothetical protein n=1 Tax=Xanthomonas cannabis TaxID=1885674 RepID=UPI001C8F253F